MLTAGWGGGGSVLWLEKFYCVLCRITCQHVYLRYK
jgi:hypothetical protein